MPGALGEDGLVRQAGGNGGEGGRQGRGQDRVPEVGDHQGGQAVARAVVVGAGVLAQRPGDPSDDGPEHHRVVVVAGPVRGLQAQVALRDGAPLLLNDPWLRHATAKVITEAAIAAYRLTTIAPIVTNGLGRTRMNSARSPKACVHTCTANTTTSAAANASRPRRPPSRSRARQSPATTAPSVRRVRGRQPPPSPPPPRATGPPGDSAP